VALVRKDLSEECITSIIRVKRISKLGTLAITDDGSNMFLQNIGTYKSHMVSYPRRQHSS
jgi:hypothetical protein